MRYPDIRSIQRGTWPWAMALAERTLQLQGVARVKVHGSPVLTGTDRRWWYDITVLPVARL